MQKPSHPLAAIRRMGIVNSYAAVSPPTVNVSIGGDTTAPIDMAYMDGYLPHAGDQVMTLSIEGDHVVAGAIAQTQQPPGWIVAHKSGTTVNADNAWSEVLFDTLDDGGLGSSVGQLILSGGSLLIPDDGYYTTQMQVLWPAATYSQYLMIVGITGGGSGGIGSNQTRRDGVTTTSIGAYNSSEPAPLFLHGGDLVSGYIHHTSGGSVTVAAGVISIRAWRVG